MPVILPKHRWDTWLSSETDTVDLQGLLERQIEKARVAREEHEGEEEEGEKGDWV